MSNATAVFIIPKEYEKGLEKFYYNSGLKGFKPKVKFLPVDAEVFKGLKNMSQDKVAELEASGVKILHIPFSNEYSKQKISEYDVDLDISQVDCGREAAIAALERHDGNLAEAITDLSNGSVTPNARNNLWSDDTMGGDTSSLNDISEGDVSLVISQANCSREIAVAALERNRGDIVNSIMELSEATEEDASNRDDNTLKDETLKDNTLKAETPKDNSLKAETLKVETLKDNTLKEDTLNEDTLNEDTLKEDTLKEDTLKEDTLNEDTLRGYQNIKNDEKVINGPGRDYPLFF